MANFIANFATRMRPIGVAIIRSLPNVRGRGRLSYEINKALLAAGAEPMAVAKMAAGHSLMLDTRNRSYCWALFLGIYNDAFFNRLLEFLQPGGVVLDVGANIGFGTIPFAISAKQRGASVVAFEPFHHNAELIRKNLRLNKVEEIVTIIEAGLSSTPHEAELLLGDDFKQGANVGNAVVAEGDLYDAPNRVTIWLETLDGLWPTLGNPRIDIIKVDIEGHEDRFLEGAVKTLATFRPVIMMEVNRWFYQKRGLDFDTLIPSLMPSGYRIYSANLTEIKNLADWNEADVLFIPEEKMSR